MRVSRQSQGLPDRRKTLDGKAIEFTDKQREEVALLAAYGTPYEKICKHKIFRTRERPDGISEDTLVKYFRPQLDKGLEYANAELGGVLFLEAKKGNVRAIEQWFDRRGGQQWKRKVAQEHSGPDGGPIRYTDLTEEELDAKLEALAQAAEEDGIRVNRPDTDA
jgi:hypothetical protein